jgi:acyl carrier protein
MPQREPMSFEAFRTLLAEIVQVAPEQLVPNAYWVTDLGVDSIRMVEVLLRLQHLGLEIRPELAWQLETVGDAYALYQSQATKDP